MKKTVLFFQLLLIAMLTNAIAQTEIKLNSSLNGITILEQNPNRIKLKMSLDKINTLPVNTVRGNFIELTVDGLTKIYDAGKPQLPEMNRLIEIPYGAEVKVNIISYHEQVIKLADMGIQQKILPAQPSVSKSADANNIPFYYNQKSYQLADFNKKALVSANITGVLRGVQVGNISIAPLRYNPWDNVLKVYNDIVFEVVFKHPDHQLTEQMKEKYYSPGFDLALSNLINYTPPSSKDQLTKYPIKYVIVGYSNASLNFQAAMQPFVKWKRQKGFTVIEQYYSSAPTEATVKAYLQGLYDAANPEDPAPTYVLLVGDVAQIPSNTGVANTGTKTDLYFFTFDGATDYLPDMYYGRF